MTLTKTEIKVQGETMWAATVPVKVIFECDSVANSLFMIQHFRMIETDGYYIVSVEGYKVYGETITDLRCFIRKEDAWTYLSMYKITEENDENKIDVDG